MNKLHDIGLDVLGAVNTVSPWRVAIGAGIVGKALGLVYFLTRFLG